MKLLLTPITLTMLLFGFGVQAQTLQLDKPSPLPSPVDSTSSPVIEITVHDLLNVGKMDEVRSMLYRICGTQMMAFRSSQAETGEGSFLALGQSSFMIPHLDPISLSPTGLWAELGLIEDGQLVYFRYTVQARGTGADATFSAKVEGDLDGDGVTSLIVMRGYVDSTTGLLQPRCREVTGRNPLE